MSSSDPTRPLPPQPRTTGAPGASGSTSPGIDAYVEGADGWDPRAHPDAMAAEPPAGRPGERPDDLHGRRWGTPAIVFTGLVSLLLGAILMLLVLPEDEPSVAVLPGEQAAISALEAEVAARDAQIASLQAAAEGDAAAADEALAAREAALEEREAAIAGREAAIAEREAQVAAAEAAVREAEAQAGAAGIEIPDLGEVQLPEISESEARGAFDRLVERLQGLLGIE